MEGVGLPYGLCKPPFVAERGGTRNDDGFSGPIDLGFTLSFFGQDYTQFWADNNGNISFTDGISAYTPIGPQGAPEPIISPFFADVDTTDSASDVMYLRNDIPNVIIVTWDGVGYYDSNADRLDSFQLVLRGPDYTIPTGEGAIGFFYKSMQWETGDVSNTHAAVGFGNGIGMVKCWRFHRGCHPARRRQPLHLVRPEPGAGHATHHRCAGTRGARPVRLRRAADRRFRGAAPPTTDRMSLGS